MIKTKVFLILSLPEMPFNKSLLILATAALLSLISCSSSTPESTGAVDDTKQQAFSGKIDRIENLHSKFVTERNIDIWLPQNYDGKKKCSVLYMHDGQMLFDTSITWNKQSWDVDDVATTLLNENKIKDLIVVGIWNSGKLRHKNYFPQKPFDALTPAQKDFVNQQLQNADRTTNNFQPDSDNYLKFLVSELKPLIDKTYSVHTDQQHTFIAGSSMGGLISMYAICEYPQVFGGAACISTHWPGIFEMENNPIPDAFVNYLNNNLPESSNHKIYFDYGDQTLDALYSPLQKKVDEVMIARGFSEENWQTLFFEGKDHSEQSWKERFDRPLVFLLGN